MNPYPSFHATLTQHLVTGVRASSVLLVLCGALYTGLVTRAGGLLFADQAKGSLIHQGTTVVGSELVAQPFVSQKYFHGRPSAADYDPTATSGSNLAPSNPELKARVTVHSAAIQVREGVSAQQIPVDLLAASGSGLDPHISPQAAMIQAPRIAKARQLELDHVKFLIREQTEGPQWGLFGQPRVNVLKLNLALNQYR